MEIGIEQDNHTLNLEGKTEGIVIGPCQGQIHSLGLGQVLE